ncbi:hypothetical protein I6F30_16255 [Bradyrhizobium sp. NBAIM20]|uniref:hypothetical protein n=1 Tax=unclassified Bradyrhizobium TaxID=2631580 RepID=UPI001CD3CF94|nr:MULTISPECIES: hypothetical protein [unclassified Bradyrhizobium]MCA1412674.1 hypothetical protein [Bradyrhizobium sp. NBAIM20]MCA1463476.1 hypothetical protein [Bradyrhizobium sp. NBAIM18]
MLSQSKVKQHATLLRQSPERQFLDGHHLHQQPLDLGARDLLYPLPDTFFGAQRVLSISGILVASLKTGGDHDQHERKRRIINLLDSLARQEADLGAKGTSWKSSSAMCCIGSTMFAREVPSNRMIVRHLKGLREGSQLGRLIFEEFDMGDRPWVPPEVYGWDPD